MFGIKVRAGGDGFGGGGGGGGWGFKVLLVREGGFFGSYMENTEAVKDLVPLWNHKSVPSPVCHNARKERKKENKGRKKMFTG